MIKNKQTIYEIGCMIRAMINIDQKVRLVCDKKCLSVNILVLNRSLGFRLKF